MYKEALQLKLVHDKLRGIVVPSEILFKRQKTPDNLSLKGGIQRQTKQEPNHSEYKLYGDFKNIIWLHIISVSYWIWMLEIIGMLLHLFPSFCFKYLKCR